jgi:hypothetical protein
MTPSNLLLDTYHSLQNSGRSVKRVHFVKDFSIRLWPIAIIFIGSNNKQYTLDLLEMSAAEYKTNEKQLIAKWKSDRKIS